MNLNYTNNLLSAATREPVVAGSERSCFSVRRHNSKTQAARWWDEDPVLFDARQCEIFPFLLRQPNQPGGGGNPSVCRVTDACYDSINYEALPGYPYYIFSLFFLICHN
jgi:hypothetical protein